MPRYRTIKPEFWPSEQVMALSIPARLCFIGMWNFCDDYGVHPASCRTLSAEVFPGDGIAVKEIQKLVDEMIRQDLLTLFQDERGKSFWYVTGWHHQVINRPSKSRHAIPPTGAKPANKGNSGETLTEHSLSNHGAITDTSLSTHNRDEMNRDEMSDCGSCDQSASGKDKTPAKEKKENRGTRMKNEFAMPGAWGNWCLEERPTWSNSDVIAEFSKFKDYWISQPGQKGVKADWLATWRFWVRNSFRKGDAV